MNQSRTVRFLRLPEVLAKLGVCKATIYNMINEGSFPKPVKLGKNISMFPEHEVDSVLRAIITQQNSEQVKIELKNLVVQIHEQRKALFQQNFKT